MVGGFDVDSEPGFLESEAVGIVFKVLFPFFKHMHNTPNAHLTIAHGKLLVRDDNKPMLCVADWFCGICVRWSCSHIAVGATCN